MSSVSSLNSLLSSALMGSSSASNSGVDLSSLLQAATGSTSAGIDVTSAVDAALYADRAPERQWQSEQSTISSQISGLTTIQTALSSVSNDLDSLNDLSGPLAARSVSSSSSEVSGTAAAGATVGSHLVAVQSLATSASWYSPSLPSSSSSLGTSTLTVTAGNGTQTSFAIGSGVNSLSGLASAINAADIGVNANIVSDASGSRLALVGATTGAAADFSVTSSDPSFNMTRAGTAANASLTIDGIPISSATNTVTGAIAGLTLNLTATTPADNPATLSVTADSTQISQALSTFVSDYNSALSQVNSQFTYSTSTGSQGILSSDSTVRSLQSALEGIVSYNSPDAAGTSSAIQSLGDLGIAMGDDGSLSLDTSKLANAMTDPDAVQNFFQGSTLNGFAQEFSSMIGQFNDPAVGAITNEIQNLNQQYSDLQSQVNDFESGYIASQQTVLTAMYSKAEVALQQLPAEMQEIQAQLGNNNNGNG